MNKSSYTLKNSYLEIVVNQQGAELASIRTPKLEYLWQANPDVWGRHAPVLFPIVGALKDQEFIYKNKKYHLGQHGFARDQDFKLFAQADNSLSFELVATDDLQKIYPFDFVLQIKYTLIESSINVEYFVQNPSLDEDLYFSIGAHPAFYCPFEKGQKRSDYHLKFDSKVAPLPFLAENGFYTGEVRHAMEDGIMLLPDSIFDRGSLTFRPNPFSKVDFIHRQSGRNYMSVSFNNFPYLGIWAKEESTEFVCIEPWHGIADWDTHDKELTQKEGIIQLTPNKSFSCSFLIEIHTAT